MKSRSLFNLKTIASEGSNGIKTLSDRGSQCRMVRVGERKQAYPVGVANGVRLKQDYMFCQNC
jgi:hypothetical protein